MVKYVKKTYKRKAKKTYKPYVARRYPVPRNKTIVNTGIGFPKKLMMTHKYFETFDMVSNIGSAPTYFISCNGMTDPNFTLAGHQVFMFDEISHLYNTYCCIGSKITVTIGHKSSSNTTSVASLLVQDNTTLVPTLNGVVEGSNGTYKIMNASNVDTHVLRAKWSAKKNFGGSVMANSTLRGNISTNPSEQQFYTITIFPQDLLSTQTYCVQIMVEYIAVWTELKDIAGS